MSIFDDEFSARLLPDGIKSEVRATIRATLERHGVSNADLEDDLVETASRGVGFYRDLLKDFSTGLLGIDRYTNMKCFPVVVDIVKKSANESSASLGYRLPYPDHYSAGGSDG